jgi:hypothetical protein
MHGDRTQYGRLVLHMLGTEPDADQPGGDPGQKRETGQKWGQSPLPKSPAEKGL